MYSSPICISGFLPFPFSRFQKHSSAPCTISYKFPTPFSTPQNHFFSFFPHRNPAPSGSGTSTGMGGPSSRNKVPGQIRRKKKGKRKKEKHRDKEGEKRKRNKREKRSRERRRIKISHHLFAFRELPAILARHEEKKQISIMSDRLFLDGMPGRAAFPLFRGHIFLPERSIGTLFRASGRKTA